MGVANREVSRDGTIFWFNNRYLHRKDGPAIEYISGDKWWYNDGELHREDGPAVELSDGKKIWWYRNKFIGCSEGGYTQEKFERYLRELKIKEYW